MIAPMLIKALNFILFQLGWFVTVAGAAAAYPWLGLLFTLAWLAVHLGLFSRQALAEGRLLLLCALAGYVADSVLVLTGMVAFPPAVQLGWPSTVWMVALWINLGMTINYSLAWLANRPLLATVLGLLGGPAAYYVGSALGAILLPQGLASLLAIALLWAIAMPALFYCSGKLIKQQAKDIKPLPSGDKA